MKVRVGSIAKDGTYSSATGRGACSHHGGVKQWVYKTVPITSSKVSTQRSSSISFLNNGYTTTNSYTRKEKQSIQYARTYQSKRQSTKVTVKQPIKQTERDLYKKYSNKPIRQQNQEQSIIFSQKSDQQNKLNMYLNLVKERLEQIENFKHKLQSAQIKKKNSNKLNKTVYQYTNLKQQKLYNLKDIKDYLWEYLWEQSQTKIQKNKIRKQLRYTFNPKRQSIPKKMCKIQKNTINGCVYPANKRKNNHIQSQTIQFVAQPIKFSLQKTTNKRQVDKIAQINQSIHEKEKQQINMKSLNNGWRISKQLQATINPLKNSNQNKTQSQKLIKKQAQVKLLRENEQKPIRERQIINQSQKIYSEKYIQKKNNKQGNILMIFLMLMIIVLVPLQFYQKNRYQ